MAEVTRLIKYEELDELLHLYRQLQPNDPDVYENKALKDIWYSIYNNSNLYYIVVEVDGKIVSSCNISIIKNLTRNLRPYGLIENVIIDSSKRKNGIGKQMIDQAIKYDFEILNVSRVTLKVFDNNQTAHSCYEKAGFIDEKYLKRVFPYKDEMWGCYDMAIQKSRGHSDKL